METTAMTAHPHDASDPSSADGPAVDATPSQGEEARQRQFADMVKARKRKIAANTLKATGWRARIDQPAWTQARLGKEIDHEHLSAIVIRRPQDYYEFRDREYANPEGDFGADCSSGCKWFATLDGPLGSDWGVCCSIKSQRCGLLTFEHQGCEHFEYEGDE